MTQNNQNFKKGKGLKRTFPLLCFLSLTLILEWGCAITATRPTQEMSDTVAAIRAAKEVQADTLAPDLYRRASEWFFKAKHEYKFKNFKLAKEYAEKARLLAEQAEFESIRNGGNRTDEASADSGGAKPGVETGVGAEGAGSGAGPNKSKPYEYPTPTGTPADVYDQRKAEDEKKNQPPPAPSPTYIPVPMYVPPTVK